MKSPAWTGRAVALAAVSWLVATGAFYYRQVWRALTGDLGRWPMLDGAREAALPYLGEAIRSAAISIAGACVLVLAAFVVGFAIVRLARWDLDEWALRIPVAVSLGVGALTATAFALAMVGAYRPLVLRVLVAAVLIAGVSLRRRASWRGVVPAGLFARLSRTDRVWCVIAAIALLCSLSGALAPPIDYDALWFHLHFPNVFLAHGRLVDLPAEYVSLYPMMWELWFGFGLVFGGPTTATLLHYATLPLTAMLVFALTRRYARPASPWLAVALFVTAPTVLWEGTTAYVDMAFTMHVAVMLVALLRFHETRASRWLVLAAVSVGLALATKHVGLIVLALAGAAVIGVGWTEDRRLWPAVRAAMALGAIAVLVPLPWYIRAAHFTGDPLFPELFPIFGAPPERWDAQARAGLQNFMSHFGRTRTLVHQLTLPWDMTMHSERYGGSLGPLFLALPPLAAVRLRERSGFALLAIFTIGFLVLWASPIASFQLRWVLAVTPALAVMAAAGYERVSSRVSSLLARGPTLLAIGVAGLLTLNLPPFTPLHEHERPDWQSSIGWLTHVVHGLPVVSIGGESRTVYLRRNVPTYGVWTEATAKLPPNARVLTWSGGDHLYGIESRIWVFTPVMRDAASAPAGDEARALEHVRRQGITHVLIDKRFLQANGYDPSLTWESFALTNRQTVARYYETVAEDARAVMYRIVWEVVGPS